MQTASRQEFDSASQISRLMNRLWQWHMGDFCPSESWSPPVNIYRLPRRIEVCLDLAGVEQRAIDVRVEPGRLSVRGVRVSPEPPHSDKAPMRIVAMEIDHGLFCRVVPLPEQVDLQRVTSEYKNGLLWIKLPLKDQG